MSATPDFFDASYTIGQGLTGVKGRHWPDESFIESPEIPKPDATFRRGDLVRFARPRRVVRVGYRKLVEDYYDDVRDWWNSHGTTLREIERSLGISLRGAQTRRVIDALSYAKARADGFGGPARGAVVRPLEERHMDDDYTVTHTRQHRVGFYYPPSGGWNSYTGDSDHEPGGLVQAKTIVICTVDHCFDVLSGDLSMVRTAKRPRKSRKVQEDVKPPETDDEAAEP